MAIAASFADLCPGCFAENATAGTCPHCGYDESQKRGPLVLPHRTLLHNGQYLIGKVLGKPGGFGITYLALDTKLETRVAIKEYLPRDLAGRDGDHATISAHSADDAEHFRYGLSQFLQEARTLARFDHANIVRVRNFFEENGTGYLVMDYYDGITLADYLAQQPQGKLPEKTAVDILMPILDGLREVHTKNFLHRDIKPQNIYLTTGNRAILLDFGAARQAMSERSRSLSVVLSEGYAPYEQYHRRGEQGPWTDIYASAAVLYHAMAGEPPPPATERMSKDELDIGALGVSASLANALRLGLAVDHKNRPQTMAEFQGLLVASHRPVKEPIKTELKSEKNVLPAAESKAASKAPVATKAEIQSKKPTDYSSMYGTGTALPVQTEKKIIFVVAVVILFVGLLMAAMGGDWGNKETVPQQASAPVADVREDGDTVLWTTVENSTQIDNYTAYLSQYPNGKYVVLANSRIQQLQAEADRQQVERQRNELKQQALVLAEAIAADQKNDYATAISKWRTLANAGNARAQDSLGEMYALGKGVQKDDEEAVRWFLKAADQGNASAQYHLSWMYSNGRGVPKDEEKAVRWSRMAAIQGFAHAQHSLGMMYTMGQGIPMDAEEAAKWLRKAADQEFTNSQYQLGLMYEGGRGVPRDLRAAINWITKAAAFGHPGAQTYLGDMYANGRGVDKNEIEAVRWFRKAAEQGDALGQHDLAIMFMDGRGIQKSRIDAVSWLQKAAGQGYEPSLNALKQMGSP